MKKYVFYILCFLLVGNTVFATIRISLAELEDKIAGAWIGQLIGNIYGLPFENRFIAEPGPDTFPYGYSAGMLERMSRIGGAFSDDDTDFEYIYLIVMEKHGCEPSYENLCQAWMYHVRDRVWLSNRAALGLMHHGFTPPFTGKKEINPHWFQIDPQLINEIWAYTAPGMTAYAAQKSEWAAKITSDCWGVEPTIHYGAMYAEAFFEKNPEKVVVNALNYLPQDGRYAQVVKETIALWKQYPNDWEKARQVIAEKYYENEPEMTKTIWNAILNGACGILSFLYGAGDFQLTMDLGSAMGFDADNQTATIGGLLGVMHGFSALPAHLYLPIEGWTKPFNNRYINVTRHDMPDTQIDDLIKRTVKQAIDVATKNGGRVTGSGNNAQLVINDKAQFQAPLEFYVGPNPRIETGVPFSYDYFCESNKNYLWTFKSGDLPQGVSFNNGTIGGVTTETGSFRYTLSLSDGKRNIEKEFELIVRGRNIAPQASKIIANVETLNMQVLKSCWYTFGLPLYAESVNVINDGILHGEGSTFYTLAAATNLPKIDYLGYEWDAPHTINALGLHIGSVEEFGGWFSHVNIQCMDESGNWINVPEYRSTPNLPASDNVYVQPHFVEYLFQFSSVTTKAVRILLDGKVEPHFHGFTRNVSSFISVTELSVHQCQVQDNQLSDSEKQDGWLLLFDGQTLDGWRAAGDSILPPATGWSVEDNCLKLEWNPAGGNRNIVTKSEFENFEFSIEWKIAPAANSGIFYHHGDNFTEAPVCVAPEYQIIDDLGWHEPLGKENLTGVNYGMHYDLKDKVLNPVGQFNVSKIVFNNGHVEHWLNGKKILEFEAWSDDWNERFANSMWRQSSCFGKNRSGAFMLQNYAHAKMWFKNIKVKPLP